MGDVGEFSWGIRRWRGGGFVARWMSGRGGEMLVWCAWRVDMRVSVEDGFRCIAMGCWMDGERMEGG